MAAERLDKLISGAGLASRSEAKQLIRQGRITVDGRPALSPEQKVDTETSSVCLDGKVVCCETFRYFMMNKPAGVLSATEDEKQETVLDLLPKELQRIGLGPVGRLDKDTTGLLLLTNDGDMTHRIISPKKQVEKLYRAQVERMPRAGAEEAFASGITLGDGTKCLPARLERVEENTVLVTVCEGKFHQVKRMLAAQDAPVVFLHRMRIGKLSLPEDLKPGDWIELDAKEIQKALE